MSQYAKKIEPLLWTKWLLEPDLVGFDCFICNFAKEVRHSGMVLTR